MKPLEPVTRIPALPGLAVTN